MIFIIIEKEETMLANVGGIDRIIRLTVGFIIFLSAVILIKSTPWTIVPAVVGTIIFFTGLTRRCLAYVPFGLNSNKRNIDAK